GAGFSSADKLALSASIKQDNVFGTGNYLGIDINTSKSARTLVISAVDPYFTIDGISRAFDIFYRTQKPINSQGEEYEFITPGASIRFGVPFSEYDTVFFGIGIESTEIKGTVGLPNNYWTQVAKFGPESSSVPITIGWTRDGRDSALVPNSGRYQRISTEWGAGGDTRYLRANLQFQQYWAITKSYTYAFNAEVGYGTGLQGRPYPVFKNFYGGGLGSVRAFDQGTLGPVDALGGYTGGTKRLNLNNELYLPVPGAGNDRTLRFFAYLDAGNVWGEQKPILPDPLRVSAGLGLSWVSPVGPLKLSYGTPIQYVSTDRIQKLQFQIGTAF
ncbi:MAG TPA: BamA/TamA family outer membrane protein, partial [Rhizobacter sp.]|nr:BamA/TamA family outer membrane protein [Rhizobacter sp.]